MICIQLRHVEAYEIAPEIERLTNSQGRYILSFRNVDAIRNRISEEGREGISSKDSGLVGSIAQQDAKTIRDFEQGELFSPEKLRPVDANAVARYLEKNGTPAEAIPQESERVSRALAQHPDGGMGRAGSGFEDTQQEKFGLVQKAVRQALFSENAFGTEIAIGVQTVAGKFSLQQPQTGTVATVGGVARHICTALLSVSKRLFSQRSSLLPATRATLPRVARFSSRRLCGG